jgi:hypothetical protein
VSYPQWGLTAGSTADTGGILTCFSLDLLSGFLEHRLEKGSEEAQPQESF